MTQDRCVWLPVIFLCLCLWILWWWRKKRKRCWIHGVGGDQRHHKPCNEGQIVRPKYCSARFGYRVSKVWSF
ncbi:hypothetical protein HanXRQr2_Chr15g0685811 [Helianthus annuus]|uniref:Uncharacterized protein n=1 Tax=Helianthus annuus TaxID=4232 RepID=A0A9K3H2N9_HELAN|nr:hypothetical protein HanXRQr2_Chr15g0685811 [Helianthus annuus]